MSTSSADALLDRLSHGWANDDDLAELRVNLEYLRQVMRRSGVVPFVGAGLSAPFGFPAWTGMLLDFARRGGVEAEVQTLLDDGRYEEAASLLSRALGHTRFEDGLRQAFSEDRIPEGELRGAVSRLPLLPPGPVITTNFDRVLETAFARSESPFRHIFSGGAMAGSGAVQTSEQALLKIHGDLDDLEHRILTFEEYEAHYGPDDGQLLDLERELPKLLLQVLVQRPILFLGCSLRQDRTVTMLFEVAQHYGQIYHYAVLEKPADEDDFAAQRRRLSKRHVRPLWYPTGAHDCVEAVIDQLIDDLPKITLTREGNLPPPPDLFVGRRREIQEIRARLRERRLVTLKGHYGAGKTMLAIEAARASQEDFPGGVWFIELAPIEEDSLVPLTIAKALGLREQAQEPPTQVLADHLQQSRALIVLDNCEHRLEACRKILRELLAGCPELRFLATSRRGLRLQGQSVWPVPPLDAPDQDHPSSPGELLAFEAVQLFVEAAQDVDPGFRLHHDNTQAVATIVDRLDGIPLAIRLAAAALHRRTVHEIADQLDDALELLVSPDEAAVPHQKTLRRTLQWSYDLLKPEVQELLQGLSVFSGSFSRDDVSGVCGIEETAEDDPFERLQNHSLVEAFERRRHRRYRLLEVVRQFARQHLKAGGREAELMDRHQHYFVRLAEEASEYLPGGSQSSHLHRDGQEEWLERLEQSYANLRVVGSRAANREDRVTVLHLSARLWRFWEMRSYLVEGRDRLRGILDTSEDLLRGEVGADRAAALAGASLLAYRQGDLDEAESRIHQALELSTQLGDNRGIANAWNDLGNIAGARDDRVAADHAYRMSLDIKLADPEVGTPRELGVAYFNLGSSELYLGRWDKARENLERSLRMFEDDNNPWESGFPLNRLGMLALAQHQFGDAAKYFRRAYERRRGNAKDRMGDKRGMGDAMDGLARAELWRGQLDSGREHLRQALVLRREAGDERGLADTLEAIVCYLGLLRARFPKATRLFAFTLKLRQDLTTPTHPIYQSTLDTFRQAAVQYLGNETFQRLLREGRAMPREKALEIAEELE